MQIRFGSSFMRLPGEMVDRSNTNDYTPFSTNTHRRRPRAPMWNQQQKGKPISIASNKDEREIEKEKRKRKKGVNTSFINPTRGLPLVDVLYLVLTGMPDVLPYATRVFVVVFMCGVFPALIKLHVDSSPILCQRLSPDLHSPRHSSSFTLHNVFTMRCLTKAVHLQKFADQCTRKPGLQTPFLLLQSTLPALCTHSTSRLRQD